MIQSKISQHLVYVMAWHRTNEKPLLSSMVTQFTDPYMRNRSIQHCLLNRLFECRSKKTSKLRVTGLCAGNSSGTGEFPARRASNAKNVSIWWRHHDFVPYRSDNIVIMHILRRILVNHCSTCRYIYDKSNLWSINQLFLYYAPPRR